MLACDKGGRSGEAGVDGAGDGGAKGVLGGMGSSRGRELGNTCHNAS